MKSGKEYFQDNCCGLTSWFIKVDSLNEQRVYVPVSLREKLVEWFHNSLSHTGTDGLYHAIVQHFYWKGLKQQTSKHTKTYSDCQHYEITA